MIAHYHHQIHHNLMNLLDKNQEEFSLHFRKKFANKRHSLDRKMLQVNIDAVLNLNISLFFNRKLIVKLEKTKL